jgi:predicted Zn finger-like uncharacterized protein
MSLVTSCPACGTMFRVVPDQLKISEGWVRCGHCAEVFDATAHLVEYEEAPAAAEPQATEPADLQTQPPGYWEDAPTQPGVPENLEFPARAGQAPHRPAGAAAPEPDEADVLPESTLDAPFIFRRSDMLDSEAPPAEGPSTEPPPFENSRPARPLEVKLAPNYKPPPPVDEDVAVEEVSFVQSARRQAFWRRPGVRIALSCFSLLLAAALLVQLAYHDRDRLSVSQPALRPALVRMCELADCTVGPPRQIDSLVIESSAFNRLRNDAYRLNFTLRNTAPTEVAAPSIELTLTDTQDQAIVRRVLTPEELGARNGALPALADWSGSVGLNVTPNGGPRIAGYRLLAFYP